MCLPLLGLPALGHFLVPYWQGLGFISQEWALVGDAFMFLLPFFVAGLLAVLARNSPWKRTALYAAALIVQFIFLFTLVPGAAKSEMIGLAQRYRKNFPVNELRACADKIQSMNAAGTLVLTNAAGNGNDLHQKVVVNLPLPPELTNVFQSVRFSEADDAQGAVVYFELDPTHGIICTTNHYANDFWRRSMGDNMYAYRYMRP